jgi:uncharacterized protein (TIGR02996 family)
MSDESGFLRAILDDPDDDTHRLVYADWLDEHGQPERAAFLRGQVKCDRFHRLEAMLDDWHWEAYRENMDRVWGPSRVAVIDMQTELAFLSEEGGDLGLIDHEPNTLLWSHRKSWERRVKSLVDACDFRRGLIERVRLTPQTLLRNAEKLFRLAPILDLTLVPTGEDDGALMKKVFALPQLAQLTHLHIAGFDGEESERIAHAIADASHLSRLSSLWLESCHIHDSGLARTE